MLLLEGEWRVDSVEFVSHSKTIKMIIRNLIGLEEKILIVSGISTVFFEFDLVLNIFSDFFKINPKEKYNYFNYYCFEMLKLERYNFSDSKIIFYMDKRGCDIIILLCNKVEILSDR